MPYIRYEYDPNDPNSRWEARNKAYREYFLNAILLWGSLGSVIYFVSSLVSLFKGEYSENMLISAGLVVFMAVYDFFILFSSCDSKQKKKIAGKYFFLFFAGLLDLCGIVGIFFSINSLYNGKKDATLLIVSIVFVILITLIGLLVYRKIKGYAPIKLFTKKDASAVHCELVEQHPLQNTVSNQCAIDEHIYCHKCGKKIPGDSGFCSSCGTKLK